MGSKTRTRILVAVLLIASTLAIALAFGLRYATDLLKDRIEQALGPESEVAQVVVGWSGIELRDIRIKAPKGWPAREALRAERVTVTPDLIGLFSARVHVPRITVEKPYLSVLRTREGRMRLLPGLLERPGAKAGVPVTVGQVVLQDGVLEFFDASVRRPTHKTRLEKLQATVDDLALPTLTGRTRMKLEGTVKGIRHDGRLTLEGWAELAARNSDIRTTLRRVDLTALEPYLIKTSETGVRRGSFDLDLRSRVRANRLHAPGKATLSDLELRADSGPFATFMGVPRRAMVAAMKNRDGRISIDFTLEGDLDDPQFSLNENFALRMGAAVAHGLGISLEGIASGIGSAAEGIGNAVKNLFGR